MRWYFENVIVIDFSIIIKRKINKMKNKISNERYGETSFVNSYYLTKEYKILLSDLFNLIAIYLLTLTFFLKFGKAESYLLKVKDDRSTLVSHTTYSDYPPTLLLHILSMTFYRFAQQNKILDARMSHSGSVFASKFQLAMTVYCTQSLKSFIVDHPARGISIPYGTKSWNIFWTLKR